MTIPIAIYIFIISLIGLILLSIFNKKLKPSTVTQSEYALMVTSSIGIIMLFFIL